MFIRNLKPEELDLIRRVEHFVKDTSREPGGRDPSQVFEVVRLSVEIARRVQHPVHPLILVLTALFHDLGTRLIGEHPVSGFVGATVAENFLKVSGVSDLERMQIVRAVAMCGALGIMTPETVEERIVADARRLDRMGMVGLLRTLTAQRQSPDAFFQERMAECQRDYEGLFFEESRQLGEPLYNQSRLLSESLQKVYGLRPVSIDQIVLPQ
jgi:hypothetical protein